MSEKRNSREAREICLKTHGRVDGRGQLYMVCHCNKPGCKKIIDPVRDSWRADHNARWAEGGRNTPTNVWPILRKCDEGPDGKAAQDTRTIAHGKRMSHRHYGGTKRRGPPMPGSRESPFKRRMDGTVVRRW